MDDVATGCGQGREALCRNPEIVSRQGGVTGVRQTTRQRSFDLVLRQRFYVATGPGAGAVEACGDRAPWMRDRVHDCVHDACDCVHSVRAAVHAIDLRQCTVSVHCLGHCSWTLFIGHC